MNTFQNDIQTAMAHSALPALSWPDVIRPETLAAWFDVSNFATATFAAATAALVRYTSSFGYPTLSQTIDQRLVNLWFGFTLKPIDFVISPAWDAIAGDYPASDGWIRLHTNAPHHKTKALNVLGLSNPDVNRDVVAPIVKQWKADELESAIIDQGGCAAQMRSIEQWQVHEHGQSLENEPLIHWAHRPSSGVRTLLINSERPLQGIRILDMTRVFAGPVASRFLAGFGADVLRIDPPDWDEPGVIPEVTLGKRCAMLDLKTTVGKNQLTELIKHADVILHGYRADALENLGFSELQLMHLNPDLINVRLNAYGWQGAWQNRRGFDSLVQMSSGIAHYGMLQSKAQKPLPLPVQALDHGTGYLLAASVIQALELRAHHGQVSGAKMSLARTANLLIASKRLSLSAGMAALNDADFGKDFESTSWGTAKRVKFPLPRISAAPVWPNGAVALRSSTANWSSYCD